MERSEQIQALIELSKNIDEIATKIQAYSPVQRRDGHYTRGNPIGLDKEEIAQLVDTYQQWYGTCLSLLPPDLAEKFKREFDPSPDTTPKIKDFLGSPTTLKGDWSMGGVSSSSWTHPFTTCFHTPLLTQRAILVEAIHRPAPAPIKVDSIATIERICNRFHDVARQLTKRHAARPTLRVDDEYDVQDLFHALLRLFFDDVRAESWTPSYAGGNARMDFLLKGEQIVVELKMTRSSMTMRDLGDQLIIDKVRYKIHPDCKVLIAFVYDPGSYLHNPVEIENDLSEAEGELIVKAIVAPH